MSGGESEEASTAEAAAAVEIPPELAAEGFVDVSGCLLYTSPSPRDGLLSRMPSSA